MITKTSALKLASKVQALRTEQGITLEMIQEDLGFEVAAMASFENGESYPLPFHAIALGEYLAIPYEDLRELWAKDKEDLDLALENSYDKGCFINPPDDRL